MMVTPKANKKKAKPKISLAELRRELAGQEKEILIKIGGSMRYSSYAPEFLKNKTMAEIQAFCDKLAEANGITGTYRLGYRMIRVRRDRNEWSYGANKYVTKKRTVSEGPYWVLIGYAPYSDEELLKVGPSLLAAKRKREAAEKKRLQKKVEDFNARAAELGQPLITVEDVS